MAARPFVLATNEGLVSGRLMAAKWLLQHLSGCELGRVITESTNRNAEDSPFEEAP